MPLFHIPLSFVIEAADPAEANQRIDTITTALMALSIVGVEGCITYTPGEEITIIEDSGNWFEPGRDFRIATTDDGLAYVTAIPQ